MFKIKRILQKERRKAMGLNSLFAKSNKADQIKMHVPFFLYFVGMFCLYKFTYFQLGIQVAVIIYFALLLIKRKLRLSSGQLGQIWFYILWFGLFVGLMFLSRIWAYGRLENDRTLLIALRTFAIGLLMFYYVDNKKRALGVLKALIYAFFVTAAIALITTPISGWGSEYLFGNAIAQHRNQLGAVAAPFAVFCFYLYHQYGFRYGNYLTIFFAIFTLITGSRSSILQIVMMLVIHMLVNEKRLSKRLKNLVVLIFVVVATMILIYSIPFLYNTVWVRIGEAISTVLGTEMVDSSTVGRENLKEVATLMFLQKPIFGYGVDGVVCFIKDNPILIGNDVAAVYSHCNYTEIGACFGIVGLLIWYIPVIKTIVSSYKVRTESNWASCLFSGFLTMVIFDYSRIPWASHMSMYLFFVVILLIRYEVSEVKDKKNNERQETLQSSWEG